MNPNGSGQLTVKLLTALSCLRDTMPWCVCEERFVFGRYQTLHNINFQKNNL
jgi:hypothetical protein